MEKHSVRMSVGCQASGGKTGETESSVDWWVQRGRGKHKYYAGPSFMYIFLYQLHKYDCMACSWSCHFFCVCVFLCGWMVLCTTDWVSVIVVENTNLASTSKAVSCWSSFTQGTTHSLYFQAFQLVYNGTCQTSLKAFSMLLTLSQRETSTFPLLGILPVRNIEEENCHCVPVGGTVCDFDTPFVVCVFCRKLTDF